MNREEEASGVNNNYVMMLSQGSNTQKLNQNEILVAIDGEKGCDCHDRRIQIKGPKINHARDKNKQKDQKSNLSLKPFKIDFNGAKIEIPLLYASREILQGEELTFQYNDRVSFGNTPQC